MLAKRAHQENLPLVLERALKDAGLPETKKQSASRRIDLIAVTYGPGLEPALWAGINFAKELSQRWGIPLLGVDHMEGHIAANFLSGKTVKFPAVVLAVSGGHTQLILVRDINKYKLLGETLDDAAGEAFDKVARMLGLSFPGGPEIAKSARGGNPKAFDFPRPMAHSKDYNFSFSGLKTAVLYKLKQLNNGTIEQYAPDIAASFQQAAIDVLISKTIRAAKEHKAKTVMLAGGVAANKELREQLGEKIKREIPHTAYAIPHTRLATDNAAMIAAAAYFHRNKATLTRWKTLSARGNLKID
jgi:N6-L-threonylcarbamoyladenine synthase